eukprot:4323145-Prymnesium_polylepis.2
MRVHDAPADAQEVPTRPQIGLKSVAKVGRTSARLGRVAGRPLGPEAGRDAEPRAGSARAAGSPGRRFCRVMLPKYEQSM